MITDCGDNGDGDYCGDDNDYGDMMCVIVMGDNCGDDDVMMITKFKH